MSVLQVDILLISPLDPHLAQSQILWPVEYLTNTSVYWSRLSIKSRSLNEWGRYFVGGLFAQEFALCVLINVI